MRMSRRFGAYSARKRLVTVNVYGAANETVTLTDSAGKTFSVDTDTTGLGGTLEVPIGVYTITGSYKKFTKNVTVTKETTDVYAMPDGTIVYWYGYSPYTYSKQARVPDESYWSSGIDIASTKRAPEVTPSTTGRSFNVKQTAGSGNWCGSLVYKNVKTNGGTPTLLSSGKLNTSNAPPYVIFSYMNPTDASTFEPLSAKSVAKDKTSISLSKASAGTYDVAISVQNQAANYHGQVNVYAIYFAE